MEFNHKKNSGEIKTAPKGGGLHVSNAAVEEAAFEDAPSLIAARDEAHEAKPAKEELNWSNILNRRSILSIEDEIYIPADAPLLETLHGAEIGEPTVKVSAASVDDITIAMGGLQADPRHFDDMRPTEEPEQVPDASFWGETVRPLPANDESARKPALLSSALDTGELGSPPWDETEGQVKAEQLLKAQTISLNQDELIAGTNIPISDGLELSAEVSRIFDDYEPETVVSSAMAPDIELTDDDLLDAVELEEPNREAFILESRIKELTADDGNVPEPRPPTTTATMDFDKLVRARALHAAQKLEALTTPASPPPVLKIIADMSKKPRATFPPVKTVTPVTKAPAALSANDDLNELTDFLETRASDVVDTLTPPAVTLNHTDKSNTMVDAELKKFLSSKASHAKTTDDNMNIERDQEINLDDKITLDDDILLDDVLDAAPFQEDLKGLFSTAETDLANALESQKVLVDDLPEALEIESFFASSPLRQELKIDPATFIQDISEIDVLGFDNISPADNVFADIEPVESFSLADPDDIINLLPETDGPGVDVLSMDALMRDIDTGAAIDLSGDGLADNAGIEAAEAYFIRLQQAGIDDEIEDFDLAQADDDLEAIEAVIDISQLEMNAAADDDEDMGAPAVTHDTGDIPDTEALFEADVAAEARDTADGLNMAETPPIIAPEAGIPPSAADNTAPSSVIAMQPTPENIFEAAIALAMNSANKNETLETAEEDSDDEVIVMDITMDEAEELEALEPVAEDFDDEVIVMDITMDEAEELDVLELATDDTDDEVIVMDITTDEAEALEALKPTFDSTDDETIALDTAMDADEEPETLETALDDTDDEVIAADIAMNADEEPEAVSDQASEAGASDTHADLSDMLKSVTPDAMTKLLYDETVLVNNKNETDFESGAFYTETETRDESLTHEFTTNVFGLNLPLGIESTMAEDQNKIYVHTEANIAAELADDQQLHGNDSLPSIKPNAMTESTDAEDPDSPLVLEHEDAHVLPEPTDDLLVLEQITDEDTPTAAPELPAEKATDESPAIPLKINREYFQTLVEPTDDLWALEIDVTTALEAITDDDAPETKTAEALPDLSIEDNEYFQALIAPADDLLALETPATAMLNQPTEEDTTTIEPEVLPVPNVPETSATPLTMDGKYSYTQVAHPDAILTLSSAEKTATTDGSFENLPERKANFLDLSKPEETLTATETVTQAEQDSIPDADILAAPEDEQDATPDADILAAPDAEQDPTTDADILAAPEDEPDAATDEDLLLVQDAIITEDLPSSNGETPGARDNMPQASVSVKPDCQDNISEPEQTPEHADATLAVDSDFVLSGNFVLEQDSIETATGLPEASLEPVPPEPQVLDDIPTKADLDAEFEIASDPMRELVHSIPSAETPYNLKAPEQLLQDGYEEYVMEHDPLTELELSVSQFENHAAFNLAELEPAGGATASNAADITGKTLESSDTTITQFTEPVKDIQELAALDEMDFDYLVERQKASEPPLELYQPELDSNFRIEDLGIDLIDFYRDKVIMQTEADYREYIKSPNMLNDEHSLDQDMAAAQLHNVYQELLSDPPEPLSQMPPDTITLDETTAPAAMSAEPLSLETMAFEDEIITLEEPVLPENLTNDPVIAYNDLVQSTTTATETDAVELEEIDSIEDTLTDRDHFAASASSSEPAAKPADDDDDKLLSLAEISAAPQPESKRVQIAEPDANLQQLVEDITTERVTSNVLKHMPQTLLANEQFSSDLRPMINIISNTQVMENVMNHMIDRVLNLRLLPQLEGIIRNTVRDVLKEELDKHQKPEKE